MLDIYIEKAFLDDFYLSYDEETASNAQKTLYKILVEYPEIKWFIDCPMETSEDFEKLKQENPLFALKAVSFPPQPVESIESGIQMNTSEKSVLVLTKDRQDWNDEAEKQGLLCLSIQDYEKRIEEIIQKYHYKIDLSEDTFEWENLQIFSVLNHVVLNDNYILTDKDQQKIDHNLSPLLKQCITQSDREFLINIYSKDFGEKNKGLPAEVKEAVKERKSKLNRVFANYKVKFKIINNALPNSGIQFHDRVLLTNFQSIDCGVGFNLFSGKNSRIKKSNSQIVSETIFDLYTYKRIKNLKKMHRKYFEKISGDSFSTLSFTYL